MDTDKFSTNFPNEQKGQNNSIRIHFFHLLLYMVFI